MEPLAPAALTNESDSVAAPRDPALVRLVTYRPEYREAFERLNRIWLEGFSLLEDEDVKCLEDPETRVLATGGEVFFALDGAVVVGACAAIRASATVFELAKLAVDPAARRLGVGRRLCEAVVDFARRAGAESVFLTSNTALWQAIRLYESMGFRHEPMPSWNRYATADVYMTLDL